jgi:cyanophycin synthetase
MTLFTLMPDGNPESAFHSIGDVLCISETWRIRPGMSHGLRQPGLSGQIIVRDLDTYCLEEFNFFLSRFYTPDAMQRLSPLNDRMDLVNRFLHTVIGLQQELGITLDANTHVALVGRHNEWWRFSVIMPAPHYNITGYVVRWLSNQPWNLDLTQEDCLRAKAELALSLKNLLPKSINTESIRSAALKLDIPYFNMAGNILVMGMGARSKWLQSTQSHATSAIGCHVAHSKKLTARILKTFGLPAATHECVNSIEEAETAAARLGFPVVVKPENLEQGVGVSADLRNTVAVKRAFDIARQHSKLILVERHCPGFTHRISVFNHKVVRVSKRIAGGVIGDGRSTIRELLLAEQKNIHSAHLKRRLGADLLVLDEEAMDLLSQDQLKPEDILEKGRYVRLRRRDNINAGGRNELVPIERVHPDNLELSITVAKLFGLDFAGIDLIIEDISRSWRGTPSIICEVNSMPQLGVNSDPDTYVHVLNDFFPQGWSIPSELTLVPDQIDARTEACQQFVKSGMGYGVSDIQGIWVSAKPVTHRFRDGFTAAKALLMRPDVTHAHCLMSPKEVLQFGTPLHTWDAITVASGATFSADEKSILASALQILSHSPQH